MTIENSELIELKEQINDLIKEKLEENQSPEELESNRFKVMEAVYEAGGSVTQDELYKIVDEVTDYENNRAIGGLFAWQSKGAKLRKIEKMDGIEYILTQKGQKFVEQRIE